MGDTPRANESRKVSSRSDSQSNRRSTSYERCHQKPRSRNGKYRSTNPYINFLTDFRELPENKNVLNKDLFRIAGPRWREMSDEEKTPYVNAANDLKRRNSSMPSHRLAKKRNRARGAVDNRTPTFREKRRDLLFKCSRCGIRHGGLKCNRARVREYRQRDGHCSHSSVTDSISTGRSTNRSTTRTGSTVSTASGTTRDDTSKSEADYESSISSYTTF